MRARKLSKVLAIPTPSSGPQYPFVQFRHSEFVDDEALEVAREDREECDRNEPMMLFRTLEDGIQPPVAECLTGFGRPLAPAVSGGLGNEMARSQENPNGSTRPTSGPLPTRSQTDSIQRQSALVNLRRRVLAASQFDGRDRHQHLGARFEILGFEQRLLLPRAARAHHRQAVDQRLIGRLLDVAPHHLDLVDLGEAFQGRDQVLAIDRRFACAFEEILGERRIIGNGDTIGAVARRFLGQAESRHAHQRQEAAPVADLRILDDAAGAAERIEFRRRIGRFLLRRWLNDADQAFAAQRIVKHLEIAGLKHGELDRPAWQEKRARHRKQRDRRRHLGRSGEVAVELHCALLILRMLLLQTLLAVRGQNQTADSLRRAATDAGSIRPQASNSCNNCLRAASSFHLRSRRMISSSWSAAPSRCSFADSAIARSKRAWWLSGLAATACSRGASSPTFEACSARCNAAQAATTAGSCSLPAGAAGAVSNKAFASASRPVAT